MKKGFRYFYIIAMLLPYCLLAGCSMKEHNSNIETTGLVETEYTFRETGRVDPTEHSSINETQIPSSLGSETDEKIDFNYIYRGFTAVPLNDSEMLERFMEFDEQTITTEEEWSTFMDSYCPGIPYNEPWGVSENYLIAYITEPESPVYTKADSITSLVWENGDFKPKYENDPANYVYALNSEEYTHFYVEVIAVSKEQQSPVQNETEHEPIRGEFKTVYRGFEMVSLDDRENFERFSVFGTKVIATEEDWNEFTDTFCSDIPTYETVDFTGYSLIVSVVMGARPTYAVANKIVGVDTEYGCPVFEDSATNCVHALNTENYTHFDIAVIALPREQIADNLEVWTN